VITLEKLTEFTQEDLRYKSSIKVISYKIGEVVSVDRFNNWINGKREEKISQLLD